MFKFFAITIMLLPFSSFTRETSLAILQAKREMALNAGCPGNTTYKEKMWAQEKIKSFFAFGTGLSALAYLGAKFGYIPSETIGTRSYLWSASAFGLFYFFSNNCLKRTNNGVAGLTAHISDAHARNYIQSKKL